MAMGRQSKGKAFTCLLAYRAEPGFKDRGAMKEKVELTFTSRDFSYIL
jgi:hypothetical protein